MMSQSRPNAKRVRSAGISGELVPLSARSALDDEPALARLVAGVAHEVNNPAAYVTANLAVLAEHVQSVERAVQDIQALLADDPARLSQLQAVLEQRELSYALNDARAIVDENLEGVHRISGFVRELRSFTRIDEKDLGFVHANELVNSACARVYGNSRPRARVVQELTEVPLLVADRWRLLQAVVQLLQNALDALPEDDADDAVVVIRTSATEEHVVISVLDTGAGIDDVVKAHMFEPFYSSRSGHRGLGLCMVASAARQHGGDVRVYSRAGEGARVDLVLPRDTGLTLPDRASAPRRPARRLADDATADVPGEEL